MCLKNFSDLVKMAGIDSSAVIVTLSQGQDCDCFGELKKLNLMHKYIKHNIANVFKIDFLSSFLLKIQSKYA